MYGRCLEAAKEEVVPEPFDLHVLMGDESQIDKHVEADHELGNPSGIPVALDEEGKGKGEGSPDIAEVEEIEEVFLREPERDAHCLEDSKQTDWYGISLHSASLSMRVELELILRPFVLSLMSFSNQQGACR